MMQTLFKFFSAVNTNILNKPEFLLGILAFIGALLLKKKSYEALASFIKTVVGYYILTIGSNGLTNTAKPIIYALNDKFNITATVMDPYFFTAVKNNTEYGISTMENALTYAMFAFIVAYLWNLILVRFSKITKLRTVYVRSLYATVVSDVFLIYILLPNYRTLPVALLIGLMAGTRISVFSNLTVEPTQKLTGNAGFAIGHNQMLGIWLADKLAPKLGDPEDSIEKQNVPDWMKILNDNTVSTAILMTIFFGTIMLICGREAIAKYDTALKPATWYGVYIITTCFNFSVYMNILLLGVRMYTGEIMRSFKGISERLLPATVPACDCAVVYGYAHPNVIMTGFLCGFAGQLVAIFALIIFKSPVLLTTGFVPVFFDNTTLAVYANKAGGKKAAIIIPFLSGIIQVCGSLFAVLLFKGVGFTQMTGWLGNFDAATYIPAIYAVVRYLGLAGLIILIPAMLVIPQIQYRNNKEHYFDIFEEE